MAYAVLFQLPFAKVEETEKTFRENRISNADVLSFRDRLESDLKLKNMWEQLRSGKLHTILSFLCTRKNCVTGFVFHHRLVG